VHALLWVKLLPPLNGSAARTYKSALMNFIPVLHNSLLSLATAASTRRKAFLTIILWTLRHCYQFWHWVCSTETVYWTSVLHLETRPWLCYKRAVAVRLSKGAHYFSSALLFHHLILWEFCALKIPHIFPFEFDQEVIHPLYIGAKWCATFQRAVIILFMWSSFVSFFLALFFGSPKELGLKFFFFFVFFFSSKL